MGLVKSELPQQGGTENSNDVAQLVRDLGAADAATRRGAARRLAGQRDAVTALADRLNVENEPSVIEALLTAIGRAGGRAAIAALLDLLRHDDAPQRNGAIETLQQMEADEVLGEIAGLLDDADSDVRIFALGVLTQLRHPSAAELARRVVASDPHVNVCAAAVEVLAEIGTPSMVADLQAVAKRFRTEPFMAYAVKAAIRRIA
jgi:HEAT repeat protein